MLDKINWPVDADRIARGLYWQEEWKLVEGCTPVSAGCDNCWSAAEMRVRANHPNACGNESVAKIATLKQGLIDGKHFNGAIRYQIKGCNYLRKDNLDIPLRRKKPTVFAIWNDLFHEDVSKGFISMVLDTIEACPQHIFLALTKRPKNFKEKIVKPQDNRRDRFPSNLWLGVSVEDQKTADERIPLLLQTPAAKRFVSYEPALGAVDFMQWLPGPRDRWEAEAYAMGCIRSGVFLDWLVMGFESGHGARPGHPDWVRKTRDDCKAAGVPFFFKQWGRFRYFSDGTGEWEKCVGKKAAGCLLDGREHKETPR